SRPGLPDSKLRANAKGRQNTPEELIEFFNPNLQMHTTGSMHPVSVNSSACRFLAWRLDSPPLRRPIRLPIQRPLNLMRTARLTYHARPGPGTEMRKRSLGWRRHICSLALPIQVELLEAHQPL